MSVDGNMSDGDIAMFSRDLDDRDDTRGFSDADEVITTWVEKVQQSCTLQT